MNASSAAVHLQRPLADLVREDRVHTSLYNDPLLFEQEMERIFRNTWVWVAHESEVPAVGSYKTHWVGREPVIVVRDRGNKVRVLLNRCRPRAATLCEHKKGKTASCVCPDPGWSSSLDGSLGSLRGGRGLHGVHDVRGRRSARSGRRNRRVRRRSGYRRCGDGGLCACA